MPLVNALSDLLPGARATRHGVLLCHFFCPKDGRLCNSKYTASVLVMANDAVNISYVVLVVSFYVLKLLHSPELDRCQIRPSKFSQCNDRKYENGMREMDGAASKRIPLSSRKATVSGCGIRCAWYLAVRGAQGGELCECP